MGIHYQGPLTPEERELLKPRPPKPPWTVISCRNLALRCPLLHRDGIETELDEDARTVTVRRGDLRVVMAARDDRWVSDPPHPDLDMSLESTVPLARRLHSMLTTTDAAGDGG